jgi:ABC-type transport system substrate-binding protein
MSLFACLVLLLRTLPSEPAHAQPRQVTIAQPAEPTTMDPGRSTQVLTVNYFYNLYDSLTRWTPRSGSSRGSRPPGRR